MAPVAPNGWISVDLGWIWVGYIQDGLLGPFGPTEIAPGGGAGRKSEIAQKLHKTESQFFWESISFCSFVVQKRANGSFGARSEV